MQSIRAECPECHKVYQIPEERIPLNEEIVFPCPSCKAVIKVGRRSSAVATDRSSAEMPKGEALKANILRKVKELPPMPQTVFKARKVLANPQSSFLDVAKILEADQAIGARVLKMANSAFYGLRGEVSSIQHASVVLGYNTLAEIITLAGASSLLGKRLPGYDLDAGDLWKHSVGVAVGSKIIAKKKKPHLADEAFTAGLLHDAGKLVLDPYVLERKKAFEAYVAAEPRPFLMAEQEILGFDHAEIAFELCRVWNVPLVLAAAIRYHHSPGRSQGNELSYIVHAADSIAMMSGIGAGLDGMLYEMDEDALPFLGLQQEDLSSIMIEVVEAVEKIALDVTI